MAKQGNEDKSIVKNQKPKAAELNKNIIMVVGAAVGILILLAFLFSINTGPDRHSTHDSNIKADDLTVNTDSGQVGVKGYDDSKKIDQILGINKKPEVVEKIPDDLAKQIKSLKSQQSQLQSELSRLRSSKSKPQKAYTPPPRESKKKKSSPMDREAMQAALFFPGGAPAPVPSKKPEEQRKSKGDKDDKKLQQKQQFLEGEVDDSVTNPNTVQYPISKYTIFAGTVIPGILKSRLVSNLPGNIVAIVNQDVYDSVSGQYLLIPRGSTLIGQYNSSTTYGDAQLQAKFLRIIRPDGSSIVLPNQVGVNQMGASGFEDEVDNHWWKIIGSGVLSAVFSLPSLAAQLALRSSSGYDAGSGNFVTPSAGAVAGGAGLGAIGDSTSQIGSQIASKSLNQKPTITIHEGYEFNILVTKDIVIPPPGVKIDVDVGQDD